MTNERHDEPTTVSVNAMGIDGDKTCALRDEGSVNERVFCCKWESREVDVRSASCDGLAR